jgi:NTE family protein
MTNKEREKSTLSQRAIVFQGGGALGAYEAGVFEALYNKLMQEDKENGYKDRPLFDIVAGTSIGALNAVILVSHVLKKRRENANLKISQCWEGSADSLSRFWTELSNIGWWQPKSFIDNWLGNPLFSGMWDIANSNSEVWINNYKFLLKIANDISQLNPLWNYASENFPVPSWSEGPPYWQPINLKKEDWREKWPQILSYFLWPDNYNPIATGESARRYYSYWWSLLVGAPGVLSPAAIPMTSSIFQPDTKFFDPLQYTLNSFFRFDNTPLELSLKKYWDYERYPAIKTNPSEIKANSKDNPPRLLLVTVDALDSTTAVTFDSYGYNGKDCELCPEEKFDENKRYIDHLYDVHKDEVRHLQQNSSEEVVKKGIWKSVYGGEQNTHTVFYDGIELNHVRASMSTHQRYKYPQIDVVTARYRKEKSKIFWDGAYLSNTPLREVIQAHQNFWKEIKATQEIKEIPDLEVYIVNLYPTTEKNFSLDADTIQDREIDIKFHDRTTYDVKVAEMTTDYVDLSRRLIKVLQKAGLDGDIQKILNEGTKSRKRSGAQRTYKDLIENRFMISKVVYIDRSDDGNTIFGKAFDFSPLTVQKLKQKGHLDADFQIELEQVFTDIKHSLNNGDKVKIDKKIYELEQILQRTKLSVKHEEIEEMRSNLNSLIQFVKNNEPSIGRQSKPFINRITKLIELVEQFKA